MNSAMCEQEKAQKVSSKLFSMQPSSGGGNFLAWHLTVTNCAKISLNCKTRMAGVGVSTTDRLQTPSFCLSPSTALTLTSANSTSPSFWGCQGGENDPLIGWEAWSEKNNSRQFGEAFKLPADALDNRINVSAWKNIQKHQQIRENEILGCVLVFVLVWRVFRNHFAILTNPT